MADPEGIFEQYPPARWKVGSKSIAFPVIAVTETYKNRIVENRRPYRPGAKLDDTFEDAIHWELTVDFYNGLEEDGIDEAVYPDLVNALCDSFKIHETGTLTLPTRGPRRCRAATYHRVENGIGERDVAAVAFTWIEDNEDDATASSFQAPSARSVAKNFALAAETACLRAGALNADVESLTDFAADLEALAQAPENYAHALDAKAKSIVSACERIENAFVRASKEGDELATLLASPENSLATRTLRRLADASARAVGEKKSTGPRIITKRYPRPLSLFDIAALENQEAGELMQINPRIGNPLLVPPFTSVNIFDSAAA